MLSRFTEYTRMINGALRHAFQMFNERNFHTSSFRSPPPPPPDAAANPLPAVPAANSSRVRLVCASATAFPLPSSLRLLVTITSTSDRMLLHLLSLISPRALSAPFHRGRSCACLHKNQLNVAQGTELATTNVKRRKSVLLEGRGQLTGGDLAGLNVRLLRLFLVLRTRIFRRRCMSMSPPIQLTTHQNSPEPAPPIRSTGDVRKRRKKKKKKKTDASWHCGCSLRRGSCRSLAARPRGIITSGAADERSTN
ncbi:hypothetical protein BKA80DRAFT_18595 [Phyllosticta citrichinensis]